MLWRILSYANNYRVPTVHIHIPYCLNKYFTLKKLNLVATTFPECRKLWLLAKKNHLKIYQSVKQKKKATHPTDEKSSSNAQFIGIKSASTKRNIFWIKC